MASIEKRTRSGQVRWYARYRDPAGAQRTKTFDRKVDAERFVTTTEASKLTGSYVDAKQAARTFRELAEEHWAGYSHSLAADTTRIRKRGVLDHHILPALGGYPVGSIKPSMIAGAVAAWSQTLAPGTVGQVLRQVRQILDAAVLDGVISSNPAKAIRPPTAPRRRDVHLSDDDVAAVLAATPAHYRALVLTLIGLGLRISEACGLQVSDIDFLRKVVRTRQQRRPGGQLGRLKTDASSREIPVDDKVLAALAEDIRRWRRQDGLVFCSSMGNSLTKSIAGHVFDGIERSTQIEVSPHSLRHYFGSSLISGGVSVVAVSRWLGHSSPEITWRVYSYLMASDEDAGRAAMAATLTRVAPDVYPSCTKQVAQ